MTSSSIHGTHSPLLSRRSTQSERNQRTIWRAEADDVMGNPAEVDDMYAHAINRSNAGRPLTRQWIEDAAASAVKSVEESRATWNIWHLLAEAQRQARRAGIARADLDQAVNEVVEASISRSVRLGVDDPIAEPAELRRPDGASVYDVHGATLYTSAKVLSAEKELLALAARTGGHALTDIRVEVAVTASAAKGFQLNDAQASMVRDLATSGAVVQLALAPSWCCGRRGRSRRGRRRETRRGRLRVRNAPTISSQAGAVPADLGLGDPRVDPHRLDQVINAAGRDALDVGLHHDRVEGLVDAAPRLEDDGEERALAELGYPPADVAGLGGDQPWTGAVALGHARLGALVVTGADPFGGFGFNEFLHHHPD